ncbi:ArsC family reductase [Albibacterium bauzanense]|uniref:Spx/MgsR family transcriptional regulator n=1 Tax=Albibacterium bauzanense TaxID=653929 RepID=A0A4R1M1D3_9SPHI|nr:ArsC family reductase [Albibacterium bauzanense]TCK85758.1 Spx/MgsR family transcriptional regulator [Albibacterium bauzanense]
MMVQVYGIKNCSTVKKALDWLTEHGVDYTFHDYKKLGISEDKIKEWQKVFGWEPLINKRGTTWRKLDSIEQEAVTDQKSASKLMQEHTSLIKRPIIDGNGIYLLGFNEEEYDKSL